MHEREIELSIGESVVIDDFALTVVDIENGEVTVRIDSFLADDVAFDSFPSALRDCD